MKKLMMVAGAGGFIGGHLVGHLLRKGHAVRAIDIKPIDQWFQCHNEAMNLKVDLREKENCDWTVHGCEWVYNLAADMGGMGFIENNKALCMLSVLINTHLLMAAKEHKVKRFFFSSSACVYNASLQSQASVIPLGEGDAYPALCEDGYGWEKPFSERMCRHFYEDFGLATRVARFHNVYGPMGTYQGGREKAPAAICRKVIAAEISGNHEIEIWGDGNQVRSFMWIGDCLHGIDLIMEGPSVLPINLGSSESVTVNRLVDIVEEIAGVKLKRIYNRDAPQGVRGRNSDNTFIKHLFDWEPTTRLRDGMDLTYKWIQNEMTGLQT